MKPKKIKLARGERVIAVIPEVCFGPGWANSPVFVYIERNDGTLRTECIQPDERTAKLDALFSPGAAMAQALISAVPIVKRK